MHVKDGWHIEKLPNGGVRIERRRQHGIPGIDGTELVTFDVSKMQWHDMVDFVGHHLPPDQAPAFVKEQKFREYLDADSMG
jgi:hypothetical protein